MPDGKHTTPTRRPRLLTAARYAAGSVLTVAGGALVLFLFQSPIYLGLSGPDAQPSFAIVSLNLAVNAVVPILLLVAGYVLLPIPNRRDFVERGAVALCAAYAVALCAASAVVVVLEGEVGWAVFLGGVAAAGALSLCWSHSPEIRAFTSRTLGALVATVRKTDKLDSSN